MNTQINQFMPIHCNSALCTIVHCIRKQTLSRMPTRLLSKSRDGFHSSLKTPKRPKIPYNYQGRIIKSYLRLSLLITIFMHLIAKYNHKFYAYFIPVNLPINFFALGHLSALHHPARPAIALPISRRHMQ